LAKVTLAFKALLGGYHKKALPMLRPVKGLAAFNSDDLNSSIYHIEGYGEAGLCWPSIQS
jgi:hypothetical protein